MAYQGSTPRRQLGEPRRVGARERPDRRHVQRRHRTGEVQAVIGERRA